MNKLFQADHLIAAQCRSLYQGLPSALVGNALLGLLLAAIQSEVIAPELCIAWLALMAVVMTGRAWLLAAWLRTEAACRDGDQRWLDRFRLGVFATALLWGAGAGWFFFPAADLVHQLFLAFVLAGVCACATSVLAIDRISTCGFLALTLMPLLIRFLVEGGQIPLIMGLILGLFLLFVDTNSRRVTRSLAENSRLRSDADLREKSLLRSETSLKQAQHLAHMGSYDWDVQANKMECSTEYFHCLGLAPLDARPGFELIRQVIHADDLAAFEKNQLQALTDGGSFECVYRVIWPDGSTHYLRDRSQAICDAGGQVNRMFGTIQDVTKHRVALNALQESEARFRAVFQSAKDAIITSDQSGIIVQWNQGAEHVFGYTEQEALGRDVTCLMPERYREVHCAGFDKAVASGQLHVNGGHVELHGRHQNGREFPLELSLSRWQVGEGAFFSGVVRDITERRKIERELAEHREHLESLVAVRTQALTSALELAETANRAKSVFLANMGHELRTPLNAVIGFSRMLIRAKASNEDGLRKLEIIHRSGNHLLDLINSVLELARIEAGRVHLQEESCNINSLLQEVAAVFQVKAEKSGLQFVLTANDAAYSVTVDAEKLRQVLNNLLDNAIRFTERGIVELGVRAGRNNGQLLRLEFVISDTGIGVAPDDLPRIFEPFVQLNADATSAGTGLGLPVTQQYLLMMGSRLAAQSTLGKGSVFSFVLDLPLVGEASAAAGPDLSPPIQTATAGGKVDMADIAVLPDNLRSALRDAVSELNTEKMKQVLAQFDAELAPLGQRISSMIETRRYQELWALLAVNE